MNFGFYLYKSKQIMTKENKELANIFDTVKECKKYLSEKNNDADKSCIQEYEKFLQDFNTFSKLEDVENCLFTIKDKYHMDMNDRYSNDNSYRDSFLLPMMSIRTHLMFCRFED
jgi:hypothetical protein